jgi:hypothetical protein
MRRLALVALAALALAACGGGRSVTVQHTVIRTVAHATTVGRLPAADRGSSCSVYNRGTNEYVEVVARGAASGCLAIVKRWSDTHGDFWSLYSSDDLSNDSLVCSMRRGGVELDVYDDGFATDGNATCGALASRGWQQVG